MTKDLVLQLKYLGVLPQDGHREYGFHIADKEKHVRQVILTIDNVFFLKNQLKFQEAPDLCYQKLLRDLSNETSDKPIRSRMAITPSDIESYRDSHPTGRTRSNAARRRQPQHLKS